MNSEIHPNSGNEAACHRPIRRSLASSRIRRRPASASRLLLFCMAMALHGSFSHAANRVIAWGENHFGQTNVPMGLTNIVAVAAGGDHSLAMRSNGTVMVWGGRQTNYPGLNTVKAIDAGAEHSLALRSNGTVVAWGVANNALSVTNLPPGLSSVAVLASGSYHLLALKSNGTVVVWPDYYQPTGLVNVAVIAAGGNHNLAAKSNGTVVAWGNSDYGQTNVPVGLNQVVALAGGEFHSLALKADGTVVAWGENILGATQVPPGLSNVVAVAGGSLYSLALKSDGTVIRWGGEDHPFITPPITPSGLSNVQAIAAGRSHVVALLGDGAPAFAQRLVSRSYFSGSDVILFPGAVGTPPLSFQWQWNGANIAGATNATLFLTNIQTSQAGSYTIVASNARGTNSQTATLSVVASRPFILTQPKNATNFLGGTTTFSVEADGTQPLQYQWLFGGAEMAGATDARLVLSNLTLAHTGNYSVRISNSQGATNSALARLLVSPVFVWGGQTLVPEGLTNIIAVSAGIQYNPSDPPTHQLALRADGTVVAWGGTNSYGQRDVPAGLSNVIAVSAGGTHSLALKADGTVVAWGGSSEPITNVPAGLGDVVAIAAGSAHSVALKANGEIVTWGFTSTNPSPEATNAIAIAAGGPDFTLALRSDGRVIAWGSNSDGQARPPANLSNVVAIAAGGAHGLALRADGSVVAWGAGMFGATSVPFDLSNVVAIAAGGREGYALKSDGTLVAWGWVGWVPAGLSNVVALDAGGEYSLALIGDGAPRFYNIRPEPRLVFAGRTTEFSVMAAGAHPLSYQWRRDGNPIPGAASALLTLSHILPGDAGVYSVVVSNAMGVVATNVAALSVRTDFDIVAQPQGRQWPAGFPVSFSVVADGTDPFRYQWRFNGTAIAGATNAVLTLPSVGPGHAGSYTVVISNAYAVSITSAPAVLSVLTQPPTGLFVADFNSGLPPGTTLNGVAALGAGGVGGSGVLKLMTNDAWWFDGFVGDCLIDDFSSGAPVTAFVVSFDLLLAGGSSDIGTDPPYGFSFNFATNYPEPVGEEGSAGGVSVCFDSYGDDSDPAPAIKAKVNGQLRAFQAVADGYRFGLPPAGPYLTDPLTGQPLELQTEPPGGQGPLTNFASVAIELKVDGTLWVTYKGVLVISNVQTVLPPISGGKFLLATRLSGQDVWIDNLRIHTSSDPIASEIAVEHPPGTGLQDGSSSVDFGSTGVGGSSSRTFIAKSLGRADLTGLGSSLTGPQADEFAVTAEPIGPVPFGSNTKFTVTFSPRTVAAKSAVLHIHSNDPDESPFDIRLTGMGLPPELFVQQAYLKASNSVLNERFGSAVAVAGDTAVVSIPYEATNETGAAYVFVRSGTTWTLQAYLKASNPWEGGQYVMSVAIAGDTIVVGAPHNSDGSGDGAAYVFVRNGTNWTQQAYLEASNAGAADRFGWTVAVSGDTVVVGAPYEDSHATGVNGNQADNSFDYAGAAYVFVRTGTNWTQQAYLKASNTGLGDTFGSSVAVSGDTVVVGAAGEASNATGVNGDQANNSSDYAGAAYVFVRTGTSWTQQAYLKASNTGFGDSFGSSVTVSGDTVVVGAAGEASSATGVNGNQSNNAASGSGAAYVFVRTGTTWTQQAYLKASNTGDNDYFGASVAISGNTVAVGAFQEASSATGVNGQQADNSATVSGAAYAFVRSGTNWTQQAYLKASNAETSDAFGWAVAVSGSVVLIGAPGEASNAREVHGDQTDNSAYGSGAAYVFQIRSGPPSPVISGFTRLPGGVFRLQFSGIAGTGYTVLASTQLAAWSELGPAVETAPGVFEFTDADAPTQAPRFYRLRTP